MHRRVVAAAAARTRTTSSSSSSSPLAASVVARRWTPGRPAQRATLATRASATSEAPALNASGETNKALAWKAAIDFKFVRDNAELVQKNATTRKVDVDVQEIIAKYEALNALNFKCDELQRVICQHEPNLTLAARAPPLARELVELDRRHGS